MTKQEMMDRLKNLAIGTLKTTERLPQTRVNQKVFDQLIRSSMSGAVNYRAACRAKSVADFINKLKIVEEELDETIFHYEILVAMNEVNRSEQETFIKEYNSVVGMVVKAIKTTRENQQKSRNL